MGDKIFLIGPKEDYSVYENNTNNIDALPVKNLPMSYFPFLYNTSETSVEKMKRLVPLIENYSTTNSDNTKSAEYTIDTDKLFSLLSTLEETYQPFNNKNIFHIKMFVIIVWMCIILFLLKMCYIWMNDKYTYFILGLILLLLIMCVVWALVVTSKSL